MINAKQLKPGNFLATIAGALVEVCNINMTESYIEGNVGGLFSRFSFGELRYIPLSKDWLLKFGFLSAAKQEPYGGWLSPEWGENMERLRLRTNSGNKNVFYYQPTELGQPVCLFFVHQLQNFYFGHTEEELVFNKKQKDTLAQLCTLLREQNPYPEKLFPKISDRKMKQIIKLLKRHQTSPDALFGNWGRQVWNNCVDEVARLKMPSL